MWICLEQKARFEYIFSNGSLIQNNQLTSIQFSTLIFNFDSEDMELQEKEEQKDEKHIRKLFKKNLKIKGVN